MREGFSFMNKLIRKLSSYRYLHIIFFLIIKQYRCMITFLKIQFSIKSTAAVGTKCYSLKTVKKKHSNNLFYIINFFNYFLNKFQNCFLKLLR